MINEYKLTEEEYKIIRRIFDGVSLSVDYMGLIDGFRSYTTGIDVKKFLDFKKKLEESGPEVSYKEARNI